MKNEMNSLEEDNRTAEKMKFEILKICSGNDTFVALTALTYAMSTIIACHGDGSKDDEVCDTADESLRSCVKYARKYMAEFPMSEH